jgi:hypothetical protein
VGAGVGSKGLTALLAAYRLPLVLAGDTVRLFARGTRDFDHADDFLTNKN